MSPFRMSTARASTSDAFRLCTMAARARNDFTTHSLFPPSVNHPGRIRREVQSLADFVPGVSACGEPTDDTFAMPELRVSFRQLFLRDLVV